MQHAAARVDVVAAAAQLGEFGEPGARRSGFLSPGVHSLSLLMARRGAFSVGAVARGQQGVAPADSVTLSSASFETVFNASAGIDVDVITSSVTGDTFKVGAPCVAR